MLLKYLVNFTFLAGIVGIIAFFYLGAVQLEGKIVINRFSHE